MGLIEETNELMLDWNKLSDMSRENHVIPVAVQNMDTKEVILIAYINKQALEESIRLKKVVLWSTSRNKLWFKGQESGITRETSATQAIRAFPTTAITVSLIWIQ